MKIRWWRLARRLLGRDLGSIRWEPLASAKPCTFRPRRVGRARRLSRFWPVQWCAACSRCCRREPKPLLRLYDWAWCRNKSTIAGSGNGHCLKRQKRLPDPTLRDEGPMW